MNQALIDDIYPLSPMQKGMLLHSVYSGSSGMYIQQMTCRLRGPLDIPAFEEAWAFVIERHQVLRTSFIWENLDEPVQVVHRRVELPLKRLTWRDIPEEETAARLEELLAEDRNRGFELKRPPLMRLVLIELGDQDYQLLWSHHHALMDGWCISILMGELLSLYEASHAGRKSSLPPARPYREYIAYLQSQAPQTERAEQFWRETLAGITAPTPLFCSTDRLATLDGFRVTERILPRETTDALRRLAGRHQLTLSTLVQGAWALLISRFTNLDDIIFGTVVSGRPPQIDGVEGIVGLFVNTLPLRVRINPSEKLIDWLKALQVQTVLMRDHEHSPLYQVQSWSDFPAGVPLFESILVFENYLVTDVRSEGHAVQVETLRIEERGSYPLSLVVVPGEELAFRARHYESRLDHTTINQILGNLLTLLDEIARDANRTLLAFPFLTDAEEKRLTTQQLVKTFPQQESLHELFEAQVAARPTAVAVTCEGRSLTYQQLNARANQLARQLREKGVDRETLVGVYVGRTEEMIVAILAVLKAGGAYVPLDPQSPWGRAEGILSDARITFLISDNQLSSGLKTPSEITLFVAHDVALNNQGDANLGLASDPENLAYVLFTSGSTGHPKGVQIPHRHVERLLDATEDWFRFGPDDVWTCFHSLAFDFSVWEIWGALLRGGRLVVVPYETSRTPERFYELLRDECVTVLNQTPSAFQQLLRIDEQADTSHQLSLRFVIFGGEALEFRRLQPWFERHGDRTPQLVNMYGITETTVHVTYRPLTAEDAQDPPGSAIGEAIPDLQIYILDSDLKPVPDGMAGELYIRGAGCARGYLGDPGLTARRFVPSPFEGPEGSVLYRSGDLARRMPDGEIHYLGRIDHQVKIRGFRIELGEIEAAFGEVSAIRESVVVTLPGTNDDQQLVGYYVRRPECELTVTELRKQLGARLPTYMIPSAFLELKTLPLTRNGKIDRKSLPVPPSARPELNVPYVPPRSSLETFLAELWQECLQVDRVGINDNFFELGGDSIRGVTIINKLQAKLNGPIVHVVILFDAPTIADMSRFLQWEYREAVVDAFGRESLIDLAAPRPVEEAVQIDHLDFSLVSQLRPMFAALPTRNQPEPVNKNRPTVFVLCPPRSGSTLFRVVLGGNPSLFAPPELELLTFWTLQSRREKFTGRDSFWLEGTIRAIMQIRGCGPDEAREIMEECEQRDMTTFEFYRFLQDEIGDRLLVDKTPSYCVDPNVLARCEVEFEEPRYIHLLRHPAGMIRSFVDAKLDQIILGGSGGLTRRALGELAWTVGHQNIMEFLRGIPADRQHAVRFEDLVTDPERECRAVCEMLGIEFTQAMLMPYEDQSTRMTDGIHAESRMLGDAKFHVHRGIDPGIADRWRDDPEAELKLGDVTWRIAAKIGYEPPASRAKPVSEQTYSEIIPVPRDQRLPLSSAQQRLWFIDRLTPGNPAYNMPMAFRIRGNLDHDLLRKSVEELVRRHEPLRTTFAEDDDGPYQMIHPAGEMVVTIQDLTTIPLGERLTTARKMATEEALKPFDLAKGPVFRAFLLNLAPDDIVILFTLHHIAGDGWSMDVLIRETATIYTSLARGQASLLPDLPIQYADYANWQREWFKGPVVRRQLGYWIQQLADPPTLNLPTDKPRPAVQSFRGETRSRTLSAELSSRLRQLKSDENCSLFMVLITVYGMLLQRYAEQDDITIGTATANRNREEIAGLIGFFVNTLVLRLDLGGDPTFRELLARTRQTVLDAFSNQELPFEQLVEEIQPERSLNREPLFQVAFSLQNAPRTSLTLPDIRIERINSEFTTAKYDLMLIANDSAEQMIIAFQYATDLFHSATIDRMLIHLEQLLESIVDRPESKVSTTSLVTDLEAGQLAKLSRPPATPVPHVPVHELIAEQSRKNPDRIAVVFGKRSVSYGELWEQSGRIAAGLRNNGVGSESVVGIVAHRNIETLAGLIGTLRTGGAFMPLDPAMPQARLESMAATAGIRLLLQGREDLILAGSPVPRICVDDLLNVPQSFDEFVETSVLPDQLAYLIFTSGSTGTPKGVQLTQRGFRNLMDAQIGAFAIDDTSRMLQFASWSFDASVSEIFTALVAGAALCLVEEEIRTPGPDLADLLEREKISVFTLPPSVLSILPARRYDHLKTIISAGEACSAALVAQWGQGRTFINAYGPTETTVCATLGVVSSGTPDIGVPMRNMQAYVVDRNLNLVPQGVRGELLIGGVGLARGYASQPDLTAERFIPNPFSDEPGARLYRTGDLARWLTSGALEYLGRIDQQVKLRGFRIELGEVEATLDAHPAVQKSVAQTVESGNGSQLTAVVVPVPGGLDQTSVLGKPRIELWPSIAEYFVYDELLYYAMTNDVIRNESYRVALKKFVRDRIVLDIGTGRDAILARLCVEEGARKVYAVELLPESYESAKRTIERLGLNDRVTVIHGNAMEVELPEKVDICVSEIVGPIGSMEGAVPIINSSWRLMKDDGVMIPSRSVTRIAAARLPEELLDDPRFSPTAAHYVETIFGLRGKPFDVRICLKGIERSDLISDAGTFEDLDFTQVSAAEYDHETELTIQNPGRVDGLLVWLQLHTCPGEVIDILDHVHCWQPVWFPVFPEGIEAETGDIIRATCSTRFCENGLNPDYRVSGVLIRKNGPDVPFDYTSYHEPEQFQGDQFYRRLFADGTVRTYVADFAAPLAEIGNEHVSQWQELYDETARPVAEDEDPTLNIAGWNSSYTGDPIPLEEMRDWAERTVARIRELKPRRVLEVGCGTGMLMFRVAPHCESYIATDFSQPVIARLSQQIAEHPSLAHVTAHCLEAANIGSLTETDFDVVVLNSVVQYFPSIDYLVDVLNSVVAKLRPGGKLFIGDVRNLDLLPAFHASLQVCQSSPKTTRDQLRERVEHELANENELVISPDFFRHLSQWVPQATGCQIQLKQGPWDNELIRFRYDVVIEVGMEPPDRNELAELSWDTLGGSLDQLRSQLQRGLKLPTRVTGIPNARVAADVAADRWLHEEREVESLVAESVTPDDLFALASESDCQAVVEWGNANAPETMQATFYPDTARSTASPIVSSAVALPSLANDPLWQTKTRLLSKELRRYAATRLPDYMVPATVNVMTSLPRLPSGKIDRGRLASLERARLGTSVRNYVAPRTETEAQLVDIWISVLNVDRLSVLDDFFEVGGNSLLATQAISRVRQSMNVELPLKMLFAGPTVAKLATLVEQARLVGPGRGMDPITRVERGESLPLSFAQERLWFLNQLQPDSPFYNMPSAVRIQGPLNEQALRESVLEIVDRHETLRTTFETENGQPRQQIHETRELPLTKVDLRHIPAEDLEATVLELASVEARRPFRLDTGPLLRIQLLQLAEDDHVLLWTLHHIISDGWSMGVLLRELAELYDARTTGRPDRLAPLQIQYADFAAWQRQYLSGAELERQNSYWKTQLADLPILELPTDRPRPPVQSYRRAQRTFQVSADLNTRLQSLCRDTGATPFMTLLAVFQVLLSRYSGQSDLAVGSPIAGRNRAEIEPLIGFFVNTLVLRARIANGTTFGELIAQTKQTSLDAYAHQDLPFEKLVSELQPTRDLSRSPLFQVMFILQNAALPNLTIGEGLTFSPIESDPGTGKFDLTLTLAEAEGRLHGKLGYNTDLFDDLTMERFTLHYVRLLEAAVANPNQNVATLPLLSETERQRILVEWNETIAAYPDEKCLHDLFEEQVSRTPDAIAVDFGHVKLTYRELSVRANQVAHRLLKLGARPETAVGICVDRGIEMLVGLLGVLKAGGAYVPLDPEYPTARLEFIIQESQAPVVLTTVGLQDRLPAFSGHIVCLDDETITTEDSNGPASSAAPQNTAYIIYTSGSTGHPKGVAVQHRSACHLSFDQALAFGVDDQQRVLQFARLGFDASVSEIFTTLTTGGTLCLASYEQLLPGRELVSTLQQQRITLATLPPTVLRLISSENLPELRTVISAGESCSADIVAKWAPGRRFINAYGPTENTVCATLGDCLETDSTPSIGRPLANTQAYVLDGLLNPVPVGIPGELYLGGEGLARGYVQHPELTAERFIPNPFSEELGERLYRTGDLVRWVSNGTLEFLGRIDDQVKLRGFRIELGDIEAVLLQHSQVLQTAAAIRSERLVAYFVPREEIPAEESLREFASTQLPDYMVPSAYVILEEIPLTSNGKVDRKSLPTPDGERMRSTEYVAPRSRLEEFLAQRWAEVIGIERVGIHDNFFAVGGDSIKGAILINRLQQELGEYVYTIAIFDAPTIAALAEYLSKNYTATISRLFGPESLVGSLYAERVLDETAFRDFRRIIRSRGSKTVSGKKNPPATFILSPPRSGSTLFRVMLGGHPQLFAPPELQLLNCDTLQERLQTFSNDRDDFWLQGTVRALMEAHGIDAEAATRLMQEFEQNGLSTQEFYRNLQESLGTQHLVDKTPFYALDPQTLERMETDFTDTRYLYLVRHPCAVISSFEKARLQVFFPAFLTESHEYSPRELAELVWTVCHENILAFLKEIPAERQHVVRFEDLVTDPQRTMERAAEFLGVEFDAEMLLPHSEQKQRMTDPVTPLSKMLGDIKFHEHQGIESHAADRWKLQSDLERQLSAHTWNLAESLGYAPPVSMRPIQRIDRGRLLTLSFAQERLWFLDQLVPDSPFYNMPSAARIQGPLDETALCQSLQAIIDRHETLRTTFVTENGSPRQQIHNRLELPLTRVDLQHVPREKQEPKVIELASAEAQRPFRLDTGPLLRIQLLKLAENDHVLFWTLHHIVSDGWSMGVLLRELAELYDSRISGRPDRLLPLPIQYADFAAWQRQYLSGRELERQISYWKTQLAELPVLELPTDRPRPPAQTFRGKYFPFPFPRELGFKLQELSRAAGATPFVTLLAGFQVLLARYSGQNDLAVGSPIAGRNRAEIEPLIGFFVNTLVLRARLRDEMTFRELLENVRLTAFEAFGHQDLPFEKLVNELQPTRDLSRSPLFQVMFSLQNAAIPDVTIGDGLTFSPVESDPGTGKFDLTLSLGDTNGRLRGKIGYNTDLFDESTIERLATHYVRLLEAAVADPDQSIMALPFLARDERQRVLNVWNHHQTEGLTTGRCIHELFEEQARRTPNAIAVAVDTEQMTFQDLNRHADQLADHLISLGVAPESFVGICVDRSASMIVAILGILKSGAAYIPLAPRDTSGRTQYMLEHSTAKLLVAESSVAGTGLVNSLSAEEYRIVLVDEIIAHSATGDRSPLRPSIHDRQAAYVLYTSGSTGRPNGVVVEHRQIESYVRALIERVGIEPDGTYALVQPLSVDSSVSTIYPPLLTGGCLHILSEEQILEPHEVMGYFERHRIDYLKIAPSHLAALQLAVGVKPVLPVRALIIGGEASQQAWGDRLLEPNQCAVVNHYGPTETTVGVTTFRLEADQTRTRSGTVPIGRPLPNSQAYVLDRRLEPVPVGIPGELYLGGSGLARGYLWKPDVTASRFIPDPFSQDPGARLYRTGDLVRWLPDGSLEFLGREDHQLKIHGFRVELGEIEQILGQYPGVDKALVLAKNTTQGDKKLAAYIASTDERVTVEELRRYAKDKLPKYMVPADVFVLPSLPRTGHGKIDLQALPTPDGSAVELTYVAPGTPTEETLAEVWQELLGRERVGVEDNFFELGGHSLLTVQLIARIQQRFGQRFPLSELFRHPTISRIAELLDQGNIVSDRCLIPLQPRGAKAPLFCVHPGGGTVFCYAGLARHLGPDQPVYGLQARGLDGNFPPDTTIQEMAARYLSEIREIQPHGPYQLAGWSLGGLIVVEMTRQLAEAGDEVSIIALLDSMPLPRNAEEERNFKMPEEVTTAELLSFIFGKELEFSPEDLADRSPDDQVQWCLDRLKQAQILPQHFHVEQAKSALDVFKAHFFATRQYTIPAELSARRIELFRPKTGTPESEAFEARFSDWLGAKLTIHRVDGDHLTMVTEPHIQGVSAILNPILSEEGI